MSDEKSQQQTSSESTVAGAAKTGKAISNIAKGAAAGGAHGAAIEAGKSSAKWLIPLIAAVLLPLILVAMLPSIIFGSLLGDGIYQGLSETEFSAMGLSYDGVVFADGETQVVYYNQLDERWKYSPYGTDTIGGYASGPTAMARVISSLTSETIDPPHMAQWAYEHGYWCSGNGSYRSLIPGAAQAWSLSVDGCTASEPQRIIDALAEGKLVVALMTKGHFTSSGHFIVLRGCTSDGKILVADPSSYKRSEKSWDMSIILNEASKRAGSGGPFWIIGN